MTRVTRSELLGYRRRPYQKCTGDKGDSGSSCPHCPTFPTWKAKPKNLKRHMGLSPCHLCTKLGGDRYRPENTRVSPASPLSHPIKQKAKLKWE